MRTFPGTRDLTGAVQHEPKTLSTPRAIGHPKKVLAAAWRHDDPAPHPELPSERDAPADGIVVEGDVDALAPRLPVYVDKYLKSGQNDLEVEYTSDVAEGLTIAVEARTRGPKKREAVRFSSVAGETGGKTVTKTISFTAYVRPPVPVTLTDADRRAIAAVLRSQHTILTHRDALGLRRLYEKTM